MNHKGQVLAFFLLLLPFFVLFIAFLIDVGFSFAQKRKMEHVAREAVSYALDHIEEDTNSLKENITTLLNKNIENLYDIRIEIENQKVIIQIKKENDSFLKNVKKQLLQTKYQGMIINGEKRIEG